MPKLSREDWVKLRKYNVAFSGMHRRLFKLLLDKVYGTKGKIKTNPGKLDDTDALMISLAHSEPPIPPVKG